MDSRIVTFSLPIIFLLILLEVLYCRRRKLRYYRLSDTISDLSAGTFQQLVLLAMNALFVPVYLLVQEHWALAHWEMRTAWDWIGLFLAVDFLYYWFHRASHRINLMWASHVVHHQSEEFNLTVALRQPALDAFFHIPFNLPLAVLGVRPEAMLAMLAVDTVGQFWFHTRAIDRLGWWLESWLNTPSHHRVHHARNPKYLDRNYAGVLIVWDRLFGTFEPEGEAPVYGIVKPLESWNVYWANVQPWVHLAELSRDGKGLWEKGMVWLRSPERTGGKPPEVSPETLKKFDVPSTGRRLAFAGGFLVVAMVFLQVMLDHQANWGSGARASAIAIVLAGLAGAGAFLSARQAPGRN